MLYAHREIDRILNECWHRQGWSVPKSATDFVTDILVSKIDKNPWQPEPSYAERYLQLKNTEDALDLGNSCFFARAVFPDCMQRRGIKSSYFVELGQGCYAMVLKHTDIPVLKMVCQHFEWLAEMTYTAVHSQGGFRSMWA